MSVVLYAGSGSEKSVRRARTKAYHNAKVIKGSHANENRGIREAAAWIIRCDGPEPKPITIQKSQRARSSKSGSDKPLIVMKVVLYAKQRLGEFGATGKTQVHQGECTSR